MDVPRHWYAAMQSGLDVRYDFGDGHPLLGRRMPDIDLTTGGVPQRLFTLLHAAKPLLINLGTPGGLNISPWSDRVRSIDAQYSGAWTLPVLGHIPAPGAVLIRPDGHVAWAGDSNGKGLTESLTAWFGPAA
jgi:3-(3-hydroxy-phenyl)propionate hydroxylase